MLGRRSEDLTVCASFCARVRVRWVGCHYIQVPSRLNLCPYSSFIQTNVNPGRYRSKGYSVVTLRAFRQFYSAFPQYVRFRTDTNADDEQPASEIRFPSGSELRFCGESALTWSHYRALMRVHNPAVRLFYEKEAATSG